VLASWDGGEGPSSGFGPGWAKLGALAYCDGVTVHPYAGARSQDPLAGRVDVEQARARSHKPVYITEVGWPTAVGAPGTGDSQQWTEAQQAENITNFFRWARSTGYVRMAVYFNYVDYGYNTWYGIERKNRSHKLSFAALARASAE
jgi:exo-beta-1,3-glucanase (GH17 family)